MSNFKEMWIPCTEAEYPEVKALLEGMGYQEYSTIGVENCEGVTTYSHGYFQALNHKPTATPPTVTLPELRAMATLNTEHLETLFLNFIEAVAEMREAQKTAAELERRVDEIIYDVTRKPL